MTDTLAPLLGLKHRIATSPLAGVAQGLRAALARLACVRHPELGLLSCEDRMTKACLARMIRPDWNCLDVGAHVGAVSYQLARLAPQGRLGLVEAIPAKAGALRKRFAGALVHQVAVGAEAGETSFFENTDNPGFSSLSNRQSRGETREIRVPMARIDDLWPRDLPLHFLKIDVEGHEYPALLGARATLERDHPVILFEAGAMGDVDLDTGNDARVFAFLTDLGYAIRPVFHQYFGREPVSPEGFDACRTYPFTAFNFFATYG